WTREAHAALHQESPPQRLQSGAYADTGCECDGREYRGHIRRIERGPDIDQKRPQHNAWPHPIAKQEGPGQRDPRWWPYPRRIAWRDGQQESKPAGDAIGGGKSQPCDEIAPRSWSRNSGLHNVLFPSSTLFRLCSRTCGREKKKVAPCPSTDSTQMRAPWSSTI